MHFSISIYVCLPLWHCHLSPYSIIIITCDAAAAVAVCSWILLMAPPKCWRLPLEEFGMNKVEKGTEKKHKFWHQWSGLHILKNKFLAEIINAFVTYSPMIWKSMRPLNSITICSFGSDHGGFFEDCHDGRKKSPMKTVILRELPAKKYSKSR